MGFLHLKAEGSLMFMKPDIPFGALIYPVCCSHSLGRDHLFGMTGQSSSDQVFLFPLSRFKYHLKLFPFIFVI